MSAASEHPKVADTSASLPSLGRNVPFLKLWAGETVSGLGTQVSAVALPLTAILYLKAPAFEVGLLAAFGSVAYLLVGLPSGPYVDRHLKRPILLVCNIGRGCTLLSIPVAAALGALTMAQLYIATLVIGILTVPFTVAYQSYLPSLVPKDALVAGNARMAASSACVDVVGPSIAGVLVSLLSAPGAVLIDTASYVISCVAIFTIPRNAEPAIQAGEERNYRRDIKAGMRLVMHDRRLRPIALANAVFGLSEGLDAASILLFLSRTLHAPPSYIGVVYGTAAIGSLLGALMATHIVDRLGTRRTLITGIGGGGAFLIITAFAQPGWSMSLVALASLPAWCCLTVYGIVQYGHLQSVCPVPMRGRMNATMQVIKYSLTPLGAVLGAVLVNVVGFRLTVLVAALGVLSAFVWLLGLPADELPPTGDSSKLGYGHEN